MHLIIFDVDGTLTDTNNIDSQAFTKAVTEYLQPKDLNTNWQTYRYSTDQGMLLEIFQTHLNRDPTTQEIKIIHDLFIQYLTELLQQSPINCRQIPGSAQLLSHIQATNNWDIAMATGCWKQSAVLKLDLANIPHANIPKATAEDHLERSELIKIATTKAQEHYNRLAYDKLVYVGDRLWDYTAANTAGYKFIARGSNEIFTAKNVISVENYLDITAIINIMDNI